MRSQASFRKEMWIPSSRSVPTRSRPNRCAQQIVRSSAHHGARIDGRPGPGELPALRLIARRTGIAAYVWPIAECDRAGWGRGRLHRTLAEREQVRGPLDPADSKLDELSGSGEAIHPLDPIPGVGPRRWPPSGRSPPSSRPPRGCWPTAGARHGSTGRPRPTTAAGSPGAGPRRCASCWSRRPG